MSIPVTSLLIIASTNTLKYSNSNQFSGFTIPQLAAGEVRLASSELGGTTVVQLSANGSKNLEDITPKDISINVEPPNEGDAWLPSSFYVLAKGDVGDYQLVCSIPQWPVQMWFSADPNDHRYPNAYSELNLSQVIDACNNI
ncbi:hypothetical protein [Alkalimarinus coralli]|uniref:hypothetical protein n=1 Tax=Alkalimarinus coralli TaxID=2935863 RepID=UPI00202B55AD|nr:hypothetical protein [Alkalimarinus coralli]